MRTPAELISAEVCVGDEWLSTFRPSEITSSTRLGYLAMRARCPAAKATASSSTAPFCGLMLSIASSSCFGSLVRSCSKTRLLSYVRTNASSRSFNRRSMSVRLLMTAARFSLFASEVSTRMPSDMGPVAERTRRLRTGVGVELVSSAHTEGAGFELLGFDTAGGRATALFTGGVAFDGRGAGGGFATKVVVFVAVFAPAAFGAAADRNWSHSVVLPP